MRGLKLNRLSYNFLDQVVAPFAGAWIEIAMTFAVAAATLVAPFAGAWIEIISTCTDYTCSSVAPFAGAWIEILLHEHFLRSIHRSHPSRVRGLKYFVLPFVWLVLKRRTLRGCVD